MFNAIVWTLGRLGIDRLPGRSEFQQIEDGLNIAVESIVSLAREGNVTVSTTPRSTGWVKRSSSASVAMPPQPAAPVVVLVVARRGVPLVVGWHQAVTQTLHRSGPVIDPGDRVGLNQILGSSPTLLMTPRYNCRMVLVFLNLVVNRNW